ncbi:MAG: M3 family oligoendopeptidase [Chitinophagales bacterium]
MEAVLEIPQRPTRHFLPQDFKVTDWATLEPYYTDLEQREINSTENMMQWLKDSSELSSVIGEDMRWRYVKTSIDTTDTVAQENLEFFYKEINPHLAMVSNRLNQKLNDSPFKKDLIENEDYHNFIKGLEMDLELFCEENIPIQQKLNIKTEEYSQITGQWTIEHEGENLTFQQAGALMKKTDRALRESVFRKMTDRRIKDVEALDTLFNELKEMRNQVAINAGYENYRDYMFDSKHRFDYTPQDCMDFQNSVAECVVPVLDGIAKQRQEEMGLDTLRPWDMAVDAKGRTPLNPFATTEEFVDKSVDCLSDVDTYFGERIAIMNEMNYLDLESRGGKAPGGYNMGLPEIGVPFIFMNHAKSEGDVRVMVHEAGHAVHTFLAHPLQFDFLKDFPMEVAELASMSMELFTLENWETFYPNEDDLKRAKKNHLVGLLGTLPGVGRGDEFQHWMYLNPNHTTEERHEKWMELDKKYSSQVVDYSEFEESSKSAYQRILHFYQVPFYYIEYGFAQLGAIAMWRNYKQNPDKTIAQYKTALKMGYTRSIPEIYEAAGIKFDFSKEYVSELVAFVKEEIEKLG